MSQLKCEWLTSVPKLDEDKLIVAGFFGSLRIVKHKSGLSFQVHKSLNDPHSEFVRNIVKHRDLIVTCSDDYTAKLWDAPSFCPLATLRQSNRVNSAAVNDVNIVTACEDGNVYVYKNTTPCFLDGVFCLNGSSNSRQFATVFLNDGIVVVGGYDAFIFFISLSTKSILSKMRMRHGFVISFARLSDGRIAVGGPDGYCAIISPPESVRKAFEDYLASSYPQSAIAMKHNTPLRAAWMAVQDNRLALREACTNVLTPGNCAASFNEWCHAHCMLMTAVKRGDIPRSRDYNGNIAYWHSVLYMHCAKHAMGRRSIEFIKKTFNRPWMLTSLEKAESIFSSTISICVVIWTRTTVSGSRNLSIVPEAGRNIHAATKSIPLSGGAENDSIGECHRWIMHPGKRIRVDERNQCWRSDS